MELVIWAIPIDEELEIELTIRYNHYRSNLLLVKHKTFVNACNHKLKGNI